LAFDLISNRSGILRASAEHRARIVVAPRVRRDDRSFRHWRTVRAITAISYRFLARAALLKRVIPLSIK
jgi:hypothetical protein